MGFLLTFRLQIIPGDEERLKKSHGEKKDAISQAKKQQVVPFKEMNIMQLFMNKLCIQETAN